MKNNFLHTDLQLLENPGLKNWGNSFRGRLMVLSPISLVPIHYSSVVATFFTLKALRICDALLSPPTVKCHKKFFFCLHPKLQRLVGIWQHAQEDRNPSGMPSRAGGEGNTTGKNQWHNIQALTAFLLPRTFLIISARSGWHPWGTSPKRKGNWGPYSGQQAVPQGGLFSAF